MKFLERVNAIKDQLVYLEQEARTLDASLNAKIDGYFSQFNKILNEMATVVESEAREKDAKRVMRLDLLAQMAGRAHYASLSIEDREKIADKVLQEPELSLLTEEEFRRYVTREINSLDNEALALLAYSKEDFIRIGKSLLPNESVGTQYDRGKLALVKELDKITEFENALSSSLANIMRNPEKRNPYLLRYYGLVD